MERCSVVLADQGDDLFLEDRVGVVLDQLLLQDVLTDLADWSDGVQLQLLPHLDQQLVRDDRDDQ